MHPLATPSPFVPQGPAHQSAARAALRWFAERVHAEIPHWKKRTRDGEASKLLEVFEEYPHENTSTVCRCCRFLCDTFFSERVWVGAFRILNVQDDPAKQVPPKHGRRLEILRSTRFAGYLLTSYKRSGVDSNGPFSLDLPQKREAKCISRFRPKQAIY